jgi:hypothetical protein
MAAVEQSPDLYFHTQYNKDDEPTIIFDFPNPDGRDPRVKFTFLMVSRKDEPAVDSLNNKDNKLSILPVFRSRLVRDGFMKIKEEINRMNSENITNEGDSTNSNGSDPDNEKSESNTSDVDIETPAIKFMNKLYRKLSLKTHPDKLNGSSVQFQIVNDAFNAKDILRLLILSKHHDVDIDYSQIVFIDEDSSLFENAINTINNKISEIKKTLAWNWAIADDEQKQKYRDFYKF